MDADFITDIGAYAGEFVRSVAAFGLWSWMRTDREKRIEQTDRIDRHLLLLRRWKLRRGRH